MITNIILTLYKFNSKVGRQFLFFVVLGTNRNTLPKRNRKDSGKQKCVSERTTAWAAPRKSRERDGSASG